MAYNPARTRQQTLEAIKRHYALFHESPTYDELARQLGISKVAAFRRVGELIDAGQVETVERQWRNILLVETQS